MSVEINAAGMRDFELYLDRFPQATREAMSIAINDAARGPALDAAKRLINQQVNFPEGYLDGERLKVSQFATPTRLEAKISGRDRPTSLARFAPRGSTVSRGRSHHGQLGITVQVKPGQTRSFSSGFLIGLANGNIGFAIRLRPGDTVREVKRFQPIQIMHRDGSPSGVFILYGPSVDQVFQTVAVDIVPEVTSAIEAEFHRQFARITGAT